MLTEFWMAAHPTGLNVIYNKAIAFLLAPVVNISTSTCLHFRYIVRSNLQVKATYPHETVTLLSLSMDAGEGAHSMALELPLGTYRLIWEVQYDDTIPYYHQTVITNVTLSDSLCDHPGEILLTKDHNHHKD